MLHILFLEVNLHISLTNHYLPISSEILLQVILQLYIISLLPIVWSLFDKLFSITLRTSSIIAVLISSYISNSLILNFFPTILLFNIISSHSIFIPIPLANHHKPKLDAISSSSHQIFQLFRYLPHSNIGVGKFSAC